MNVQSYIDICGGEFGRKVCYTDIQFVDRSNIIQLVALAGTYINKNRPLIEYLHNYYLGDQPILYRKKIVRPEINNKVEENHALEVVKFKVSQTYGEPIQYICGDKKADNKANADIDSLNNYMDNAGAHTVNIEMGSWQSEVGTAYKCVMKNPYWEEESDESPFLLTCPDPRETIVVYNSNTKQPILSVQRFYSTKEKKQYYACYSRTAYYEVMNGKVTVEQGQLFGGIPIVEFPNNPDRLSDIEIGITLFDTINNMQSNRMDGVEQFVQAFMKFKNCEIDENEFLKMCKLGAISVKDTAAGVQSDVELMTAELNQSESQVAKDDVYKNLLIIEGMPDRQQSDGGSTGQAIVLKNGWEFAEQRAKIDEPFVKLAEKCIAKIVLNVIRMTTNDLNLSIRDFDVKITRNSTDNMLVKSQTLDYLIKNKIHPLIAITVCGLFNDPQQVYEMSKGYMLSLYEDEKENYQVNQEVVVDNADTKED